MSRVILVVLLLVLTVPALGRSPWTEPRGDGYVQVAAYTILPYDELVVDGTETYRVARELSDTTYEAYLQHGLADGWTMIGVLPWRVLEAGEAVDRPSVPRTIDTGSLADLGNARLGLRRRLARGDWVSAAQIDLALPTAVDDAATGLRTGIDAWALTPTLSVGRGTPRGYWYGYAGLSVRTDGYSEQWHAGVEWGRRVFGDRWWFVAALESTQSLRNGDRAEGPVARQTGLYLDEQEVFAPVLKAIYEVDEAWGLLATVQGGFAGDYVARSPFLGVAAFTRY